MKLLSKAIGRVLVTTATKSVTSWLGAAVVGTGTAAAIDPELLDLIPEHARGYVIAAIGLGVILARHRAAIIAAYAQLRAELKAAVEAAERE
jgi:hypothetical protein